MRSGYYRRRHRAYRRPDRVWFVPDAARTAPADDQPAADGEGAVSGEAAVSKEPSASEQAGSAAVFSRGSRALLEARVSPVLSTGSTYRMARAARGQPW